MSTVSFRNGRLQTICLQIIYSIYIVYTCIYQPVARTGCAGSYSTVKDLNLPYYFLIASFSFFTFISFLFHFRKECYAIKYNQPTINERWYLASLSLSLSLSPSLFLSLSLSLSLSLPLTLSTYIFIYKE